MGVGDVLNDVQNFLASPGSAAQMSGQSAGGKLNPLNRPRKQKVKASQLYVMAGGKQEDAKFMGEVAVGESHCTNNISNPVPCSGHSHAHCIWQICGIHYAKLNYKTEAEFVKAIKADPMECARAAVAVMNSQGRGAWTGTRYVGTGRDCTVTIKGDSASQNINQAASSAAQAVTDPLEAVAAVLKPIGDFFQIITSADTWIRVGKVLLGAIILLFVVNQLSGGAVMGSARRARV